MIPGISAFLNKVKSAFCCRSKRRQSKCKVKKFGKYYPQQINSGLKSSNLKSSFAVVLATSRLVSADCLDKPLFFTTPSGCYALTVRFYATACEWATNALQNAACGITRIDGSFDIGDKINGFCERSDSDDIPPTTSLTGYSGETIILSAANNTMANLTQSIQCLMNSIECHGDLTPLYWTLGIILGVITGGFLYLTCCYKKKEEVNTIHNNPINSTQNNLTALRQPLLINEGGVTVRIEVNPQHKSAFKVYRAG